MKRWQLVVIVVVLLGAIAVWALDFNPWEDQIGARELPPPAEQLDEAFVEGNLRFAFNLFRGLHDAEPGESLFISPSSVSLALGMTLNGADGETLAAMAETLGLQGMSTDRINRAYADLLSILRNPDPEVELDIANSIWAREGLSFREEFLAANEAHFRAAVESLNFDAPDAAKRINDWVDEATRGRIPEIVEGPIDPDTIMFLINAIYFNGQWTTPFDPELTQDGVFYRGDGEEENLPLMQQGGSFRYLETEEFQSVALPYGDERVSMYLFLPVENYTVTDVIQGLTPEQWQSWFESYRADVEGDVVLPRFSLETDTSLREVLATMGMDIAFDPGLADFGRMYPITAGQRAYISDVRHKTFLDVHEEGTEAAAVTSVEIRLTSAGDRFFLRLDRPFVLMIHDDQTNTPLFLGVMQGT